ncbi:SDR family oxidoreductase [Microbacterium sp. NIBRBAC000506063]|uniref:SDR family oxidoreductase n=1 Tax=Microbacterium sp. NIBRBAC000506063 TaxID=2734618 RepID=UPI001BB78D19|nr:SDR family oxidoreductase [Microbacterium sp. NIBRBAC000506063]QTV79325.1 SDR family oxidoreductase [Microbacterium sp. NIBRBAC000506063]
MTATKTTTTGSAGDFEGRLALVTGAASGIGAATAEGFAAGGAHVVLLDLDADRLADRVAVLGEDRATAVPLDVTDTEAVAEAIASAADRHGSIHHVVNCAVSFLAAGVDATAEQWQRALGVNVAASAMLTAAASRRMPPGSTVVNVSSISAHAAQPARWTYNATKAAILALTRGQALDLAPAGIRVNAVSPGWIWTPEVEKAAGGDRARWEPVWGRYHMLERLGEPSEVADAILYLSGPRSTFITGTELMVDGGYSAMGPEGLGDTAKFAGSDMH